MQVNVTIPDNWKPIIDRIARREAYEQDKDYSYLDVIRDAIKSYCKIFDEALFEETKNNIVKFVENLKIYHPSKGVIPYKAHNFQKRYLNFIENNRYVLVPKFRQGGFSTTTIAWALWDAVHKPDRKTIFVFRYCKEARRHNEMMVEMINSLPLGIKPSFSANQHQVKFDNKSIVYFYTPQDLCGASCDNLIIDEAAFIENLDYHWRSWIPVICSNNCKCIALSTPNGMSGWFFETCYNAAHGNNEFKIFESSYLEHPSYADPVWATEMRKRLGEQGWKQEVECYFMTGDKFWQIVPDLGKTLVGSK